ncbi:CHASE2 domain-containing protein [Inhella proteolytica]|nr:adenylate/guanylate cyclase domain-containing protein [Inhella proteolytica]
MSLMKLSWRNYPWVLRVLALLLILGVVAALRQFAPQVTEGTQDAAGDLAWRVTASSQTERRLVVVDIDEASLREVGPWPWPRATMAQLSEKLGQAGALVQAYDMVFPEPREGDELLREVWSKSPVVMAQLFSLDPRVDPREGELGAGLAQAGCPPFAPRSYGHYGNAAELRRAASSTGHITPRFESDGVVRKLPGLVCHQGQAYPSLALSAFWQAAQAGVTPGVSGQDWQAVTRSELGLAGWLGPHALLSSRSLPGLTVPLDAHGDLRVPYRVDRKALMSVSAADVLKGRADLSVLKGTIALVGATAFGLGDTVATPQAPVAAGFEVHAQMLAALLDHRIPFMPELAPSLEWLGMGLMAVGLLVLAVRRRGVPAKRLPLAGLALALVCWLVASTLLVTADLWLPWASAALFAILFSVALATVEHALTRAQRERLSAHLGAYLPAPVAQRLMASDPSGSLQFERREISVMCADIRNFSAFAAHRSPEESAALLHAFCCIAVDVVEQHGGVVENVIGDSVVAVWNAYPECPDHPQRALAAAQELLRATRSLLASGQPVSEHSVVQPLALGVGLESGTAIVGSFGPARRRAHAALGEPVSVASRIQAMTADLSIPILLGPQLAGSLGASAVEPLGDYLLEGLSKHYSLYAPQAWAELVPEDPQWLETAIAGERHADGDPWAEASDHHPLGLTSELRDA